MSRPSRGLMLLLLLGAMPAAAETLQCRAVNGDVTCAGDGGASCQTVNGRTVCVGRDGGIVQEFGSASSRGRPAEAEERRPAPMSRAQRLAIERQGSAGLFSLERDGTRLRLRTERWAIERD